MDKDKTILDRTNELIKDIDSLRPEKYHTRFMEERQFALLRQTIYHALERAFLDGYDTAAAVATTEADKIDAKYLPVKKDANANENTLAGWTDIIMGDKPKD